MDNNYKDLIEKVFSNINKNWEEQKRRVFIEHEEKVFEYGVGVIFKINIEYTNNETSEKFLKNIYELCIKNINVIDENLYKSFYEKLFNDSILLFLMVYESNYNILNLEKSKIEIETKIKNIK